MIKQNIRNNIDWPQPFETAEYRNRQTKVRQSMGAAQLDALYVLAPANVYYLTGYDHAVYQARNIAGLVVQLASPETIFFEKRSHQVLVATTPGITDVEWFELDPTDVKVLDVVLRGAKQVAARLKALRVRTVGLEDWTYSPHGHVTEIFRRAFTAAGMEVRDATLLIEEIRLIKSTAEVEVMRKASAAADVAMGEALERLEPGLSETAIEGIIMSSLMRNGCGYPALCSMIGSGPRSGAHHGIASQRRVQTGDLLFIDFGASMHRYTVNLARTMSIGRADERWCDLLDRTSDAYEEIASRVRVGESWLKTLEVAKAMLNKVGADRYIWWIGGYTMGIAMPPDWTGNFFVEPNHPIPDRPIETGMTFQFEIEYDVFDDWAGGTGAGCIETFIAGDSDLEIMSRLPRKLLVADC